MLPYCLIINIWNAKQNNIIKNNLIINNYMFKQQQHWLNLRTMLTHTHNTQNY